MSRSGRTRRELLGTLAGVALIGCAADAPGGDDGMDATGVDGGDDLGNDASPDADPLPATCTVYPQSTEGPFYLDLNSLRADITEDKAGSPLTLRIRVLDADGCTPLANVAVDVWQCDAGGVYSGYPGQLGGVNTTGQTFLRGTQVTGADGRATFTTIYPGWYPGRTTHIHFKLHLAGNQEATGQLYFPEDVTSAMYATAPYAARGQKDTSNSADGPLSTEPVASVANGVASLNITVA